MLLWVLMKKQVLLPKAFPILNSKMLLILVSLRRLILVTLTILELVGMVLPDYTELFDLLSLWHFGTLLLVRPSLDIILIITPCFFIMEHTNANGPHSFHFMSMWPSQLSFKDLVAIVWKAPYTSSPMIQVINKLKKVKESQRCPLRMEQEYHGRYSYQSTIGHD